MTHAHSPAPFRLRSSPPDGKLWAGCHLIIDSFGDSCASLAWQTGDHPADEQLANAQLFISSPELLRAAAALLFARERSATDGEMAPYWALLIAAVAQAQGRA